MRRKFRGISLVEIVLGLAIIVVLVTAFLLIAGPVRTQVTAKSEADKLRTVILSLENAAADLGGFPVATCDTDTAWTTDQTCLTLKEYLKDLANYGYSYYCTAGGNPLIVTPPMPTDIANSVRRKVDKLDKWTCNVNANNEVECLNTVDPCSNVTNNNNNTIINTA